MASRKSKTEQRKKNVKDTQEKLDDKFLKAIQTKASDKDVEKLTMIIQNSMNKDDTAMVQKCCEAVARACQSDDGFFALYRGGIFETMEVIKQHMGALALDVDIAHSALIEAVAKWLAEVDHVDFFRLPQVLELTSKFAGAYKAVALSAVSTLDRFAMQQVVHRITILKSGGLHLLHQILATHRAPEFCQETIELIYHVCDVPREAAQSEIARELSLITTVIETLDEAPVNMRLQFTGLRLLALWQNFDDKKISSAMAESKVAKTLKRALGNLQKGGFMHAAAWLDGLASVALEPRAEVGKGKRRAKGAAKAPGSNAPSSVRSGDA
jgi:hypothetical protein